MMAEAWESLIELLKPTRSFPGTGVWAVKATAIRNNGVSFLILDELFGFW